MRLTEIEARLSSGQIRLGMTPEQLLVLIGDPDAKGGTSRKHRLSAVWKYGEVEFHWERQGNELGGLFLVMVDDSEERPEPIVLLEAK